MFDNSATLPDGRTVTNKGKREYVAIVAMYWRGEWCAPSWASRFDLAEKAAQTWRGRCPSADVRIIPVDH